MSTIRDELEAWRADRDARERYNQLIEQRKERLGLLEVDVDAEAVRACGCQACPTCRPAAARAAELTGLSFMQVLVYLAQTEQRALDRLLEIKAPAGNRAQRRRQQRFEKRARRPA